MSPPKKNLKDKKKMSRESMREQPLPEQSGNNNPADPYNGDDKHGPLEEEMIEKERK